MAEIATLMRNKHIKFFVRCLATIPQDHEKLDSVRVTLALFSLSGLDLLGALDKAYRNEEERRLLIDWVYSFQVLPDKDDPSSNLKQCGFLGSSSNGGPFNPSDPNRAEGKAYDCSHIAATYASLAMLLILGDDLSRVNRKAVLEGLRAQQRPDGCFSVQAVDSESDLRFAYCACAVCYMLNDWSTINTTTLVDFIARSRSYEGAFGQGPGLECHGGSTFCAVASLHLLGLLPRPKASSAMSATTVSSAESSSADQSVLSTPTPLVNVAKPVLSTRQVSQLQRWCVNRQQSGYNGRPNKATDTCYSFWIGASLKLLDSLQLADWDCVRSFVLSTQCAFVGGFGKWPAHHPDPLHSYMGLAGLSLMEEPDLEPLHPSLNISQRAFRHLQAVQASWS